MKTIIIVCFIGIFCSCKIAKDVKVQENHDINSSVELVRIDPLGNILILDKKNNLTRINQKNNQSYIYANNTLGNITSIDVSDPLKVIIYKKEYGLVIYLDNTLNEINRTNLYDKGYTEIPTVAGSNDGQLWIYDVTDYRLKKIRRNGSLLIESNSLLDFGLQDINPSYIIERNGKIAVQDNTKGVYLFDNLGQYIQLFPFKIKNEIQFDGSRICYFHKEVYTCYHTTLFDESSIAVPENKKAGLLNVKAGPGFLYYIYKDGIDTLPIRS